MLNLINKILWSIATSIILISSLYLTIILKFPQFKVKQMFYGLFEKNNKGLQPIQVLMMTLAGRIGIGSIAGVALAIYIGGIGSIFWIWIISFLASVLAFCETVLGIRYNELEFGDIYIGGPSFYINKGLKFKKVAFIYAILILVSYIGGFLGIQSNTISKSLFMIFNINPIYVTMIIVLLTGFVIFGGIQKIADFTTKLVPIMTIFYLGIVIYIIAINFEIIPTMILEIVSSAFNFKSFFGGFLLTFIVGIQRGIFSSEAGIGTGAIASSTNRCNSINQGYIQILGVYITNMLICTATAFVIILSNYNNVIFEDINGIEIVLYAFRYHLGSLGNIVVIISIFLFSFSTILTGYYYGEASLKYLLKNINNNKVIILKLITLLMLFIGGVISSSFIWSFVDIFVAILTIINIIAIILLKNSIITEYKYYKNKKCGKM